MWCLGLIFLKVFQVVTGGSSPKYVWPICSKSYNIEVQDGGQTHPIINAIDYQFIGPHPSIDCDPINFDGTTYTHMDLPVNDANEFASLSFCVFIKAAVDTGTVLHYRSQNGLQEIIMFIENGYASVTYNGLTTLKTDTVALTVNKWCLLSFISYKDTPRVNILLTDDQNHWEKFGSALSSALILPGTIRIGSRFDDGSLGVPPEQHFKGQMICLAMYDSEFSYVDYADSLASCGDVSFPAASKLPSTPAPPPPVVCNATEHKHRNDTHFSRLTDQMFVSSIIQLEQRNSTTIRICATYCVGITTCVAFTVTDSVDGLKTCRLYDVFDTASIVADSGSSIYVLHSCRFL